MMILYNYLKCRIYSVVIIFFILLFFLAPFNSHAQHAKTIDVNNVSKEWCGQWEWEKNRDSMSFSLTIKPKGELLVMQVCSVSGNGARIDCASGDAVSSVFRLSKLRSVVLKVRSAYTGKNCVVRLKYKGNRLIWIIHKAHTNDCYFPKVAVLKRND